MTVQTNDSLTVAKIFTKEHDMSGLSCEWGLKPATKSRRRIASGSQIGDCRTTYYLTTDLESGNDAQVRATCFGIDLRILFPRETLPVKGWGLLVALDELLLDVRGRREYLARFQTRPMLIPTVVLSHDFLLAMPTVVRPGLMLAKQLDETVFRALRDGEVYLPADKGERRKAA